MAIIGAGTIGLLAAQAAQAMGASPILIDPVAERLALAKSLGVAAVINPSRQDAVKTIAELTDGRMAPVVLEASGATPAIRATLDYAAYAGRIALIGWPKEEVSLPTALITKKELDVRGSRNSAPRVSGGHKPGGGRQGEVGADHYPCRRLRRVARLYRQNG